MQSASEHSISSVTHPISQIPIENLMEQYKQLQSDMRQHKADVQEALELVEDRKNRLMITFNRAQEILDEIGKRMQDIAERSRISIEEENTVTRVGNEISESASQNSTSRQAQEATENDDLEITNQAPANGLDDDNEEDTVDNGSSHHSQTTEEEHWLREVKPVKSPYVPQKYDHIVYFKKGHKEYLKEVEKDDLYEIDELMDKPWKYMSIDDQEFVRVISVSYYQPPIGLCELTLERLDDRGRPTKNTFTIRYHDVEGIADFLVLRQVYEASLKRDWHKGDKFKCAMDSKWYTGTVTSVTGDKQLVFQNILVKWDKDGETETMSQWELEPLDVAKLPRHHNGTLPILPEEVLAPYAPAFNEWPTAGRERTCQAISRNLDKLRLKLEEDFYIQPFFDLGTDPSYMEEIAYPIDLTIIKARLENKFYRRLTALEFDIDYLITNVKDIDRGNIKLKSYSKKNNDVLKSYDLMHALLMKIIQKSEDIDVEVLYNQLSRTHDPAESVAGTQSSYCPDSMDLSQSEYCPEDLKAKTTKERRLMLDWHTACNQLLNDLWEDENSKPFRAPVDLLKHPNYEKEIAVPMDLQTVKEQHTSLCYKNPKIFDHEMNLIFKNSKQYNTDKRSKIIKQTEKLESIYRSRMDEIIKQWQIVKKKGSPSKRKSSPERQADTVENVEVVECPVPSKKQKQNDVNANKAGPSGMQKNLTRVFESNDDEDKDDESAFMRRKKKSPKKNTFIIEEDSDDDETPLECRKKTLSKKYPLIDEDDSSDDDGENSKATENDKTDQSEDEFSDDEDFQEKNPKLRTKSRRARKAVNKKLPVKLPSKPTRKTISRNPPAESLPVRLTPAADIESITSSRMVPCIIGRVMCEPYLDEEKYSKKTKIDYDLLEIFIECGGGKSLHVKAWDGLARMYHGYIKKNKIIKIMYAYASQSDYNKGDASFELTIRKNSEVYEVSETTGKLKRL